MNDSHYCPHTPEEIAEMLSAIGVASVEDAELKLADRDNRHRYVVG